MVPESENTDFSTGADSHMGNIRVFLIVAMDRQEIRIHRFHVSTVGFGEHRFQRRKPLRIAFECE